MCYVNQSNIIILYLSMIKHLYIHLPFCKRICAYCDFSKRVSSRSIMEAYKNKLIEEIEFNKDKYKFIETIYIGGGTPSFYPYLIDILSKIKEVINLKIVKEYTIESTLETVLDYKNIYSKYGINRISIGIESFNTKTLEYISRPIYSLDYIKHVMNELNKYSIFNINFDLIYSLPYETIESINKTLDYIEILKPNHISYYDLIIENKTKLFYDLKNNKIKLLDEDTNLEMERLIDKRLESLGYIKYEISNYAYEGYKSLHNLSYWNLEEYLGLGLSAHSQYDNKRYSNTTNMKEYLSTLDFNMIKSYYDFNEESEYLLMGLRKIEGISLTEYKNKYNIDPIDKYNLNKHIDSGLLEIKDNYLRFTKKGLDLSNIVFEEFV